MPPGKAPLSPAGARSLRQPPHNLARPAPVHGQAHQFARGIQHFPEPAVLPLPDREPGLLLGCGVVGLGQSVLQSS
jgi:hypothetical protein